MVEYMVHGEMMTTTNALKFSLQNKNHLRMKIKPIIKEYVKNMTFVQTR